MRPMVEKQQKKVCPDCGGVPTNHFFAYLEGVMDIIVTPTLHISERIRYDFKQLFLPVLAKIRKTNFVSRLVSMLSIIKLGYILDMPDEKNNWRSKVFWEEANRRGIEMKEFRLFGKQLEWFIAKYNGKTVTFEGLPRPEGSYNKSLIWMDNKGTIKKKFLPHDIPMAQGSICARLGKAKKILSNIHGPVIVKPHLGSRSRHTFTHIINEVDLGKAFKSAKRISPLVIVEEELKGFVFRALLINKKLVGIIRREPPYIVGNDISTIKKLIGDENKNQKRQGPIFHTIPLNEETQAELERQHVTYESIPIQGQLVLLGQKVGRSGGGSTTDMTGIAHQSNIELFEKIGNILNDPLVGIDFIIDDITKPWYEQKACGVIECNSLPFIDLHHYPLYGEPRNVAGMLWDLIFPESNPHTTH